MNRVLLRGARVITMAPHRPDTERADNLIDGDTTSSRKWGSATRRSS